jgi:hypothetical protein
MVIGYKSGALVLNVVVPVNTPFLLKETMDDISQKTGVPEIDSTPKPFSMGYVLRTTAKHMRKSIDISIRKTFERVAEFAGDQDKSAEVFKTLASLHAMRKQLDDFQHKNSEDFKGQ